MDISFEDKLNFNFQTNQKIIKKIGLIDSFKGKWELIERKNNRYLRELRKIATIESIGSSTRIEGVILTNQEIEQLIKGVKITEMKTRDEQEVIGYFDVLEIILDNAKSIEISESYIKQLHSILLKYSDKDQRHRGIYKSVSNQVVANYPDGSQRIIFQTTPPHLTENAMFDLMTWTKQQMDTDKSHPLIVIAFFVYEFLSIHPFQDGNGRLSRLVTTLLLLKTDYDFAQYVSFESIIEERKADYYKALMAAQQYRNTNQEIISEWILFFLNCVESLIDKLKDKYSFYETKNTYLNDRQKLILTQMNLETPMKLNDFVQKLPSESINTLKKDIKYLVEESLIQAIGKGKGTVYLKKTKD